MAMKPLRAVRRFDVFAEYRKQQEEADGRPANQAKGYGLWVAKVVASRRFRGPKPRDRGERAESGERKAAEHLVDGKWHTLDGEPQTDTLFDREIVARMGEDFYRSVFVPAIRDAREQRKSYEAIRDSIRQDWKPT
jgi:hypothetical protein